MKPLPPISDTSAVASATRIKFVSEHVKDTSQIFRKSDIMAFLMEPAMITRDEAVILIRELCGGVGLNPGPTR